METQLLKKDLEQGPDASGGRCQQGQIDECRTDIMLRQNIQMTCMMASQQPYKSNNLSQTNTT